MSKDKHSFNVEVAKKYSIDIAIFLESLAYWIHLNMANKRHFYDGRYWTRNTLEAFEVIFPYWSKRQLERVVKNCIEAGLLLKGNYNKHKYDQTGWYTLTDLGLDLYNFSNKINTSPNGEMKSTKRGNVIHQTVTTIPITNTVTNNKSSCSSNDERQKDEQQFFEKFWELYPFKKKKKSAKQIWIRNNLEEIGNEIIAKLKEQINNDRQWLDGFAPLPDTYLRQERWKDDIELKRKDNEKKDSFVKNNNFSDVNSQSTSYVSLEDSIARDREYRQQHSN